jgi:hypothetical protein
MLCDACEGLFGRDETEFSKRLFYPINEDDKRALTYGPWLLRFCVSVSWRVLVHALSMTPLSDFSDKQREMISHALQIWRSFLRGEAGHPGIHEQHLLPCGGIADHNLRDMPKNANRYLMRALQIDIAISDSQVLTYAKMGPLMLFGFVQPPSSKWEGTKVHVRDGIIRPQAYRIPANIFDYVKIQMNEVASKLSEISERQWGKIDGEVRRNIDRMANSKQMEAMLRDARLFGDEAVIRRPKKNAESE